MAYKRINLMDVFEIVRRWHSGQTISQIARTLGYDRKTVRSHICAAIERGIGKDKALPTKEIVLNILKDVIREKPNTQPVRHLLEPYQMEIIELVTAREYTLKPKIAFEVICRKYQLDKRISYSSFKRFYRERCKNEVEIKQGKKASHLTCRIETAPGQLIQIDYARMGLLYDVQEKRRRTVYAFIATFSHSRHKYIEFVFKQDQKSFVASHIRMLNFFGGAPETIASDNLKSGVIKPDLYDPRFNRLYLEMAEYYGLFLDPCRVGKPKDKGKVERDVQTVRQQFNKIIRLHINADIHQANQHIIGWIRDEYGQKEHGTTGLKPLLQFKEHEKPKLKPLPFKPFELAEWKSAKVHPDCFVQYRKKFYSVPHQYVGKPVWIKATDKIVSIYYDEKLIKQHLKSDAKRHTDFRDFPDNVRMALSDEIPRMLIAKAWKVGPYFKKMVAGTLKIHAFLNLRRAQGFIAMVDSFEEEHIELAAQYIVETDINPTTRQFKHLVNLFCKNGKDGESMTISETTQSFIRSIDYFDHRWDNAKD